MSQAPVLDFEALVAPAPEANGDEGADLFAVLRELDEYRKEVDPNDYPEDDPRRPDQPKKADWPAIERLCTRTLRTGPKNMRVATRLVEALTRQHGFAGLRDGLRLLRELVERCWETLDPPIENGDVEARAAAFYWLDDPDRGARFPNTVRSAPLFEGEGDPIGLMDLRQSREGARSTLDAVSLAECEARAAEVAEALTEFSQLCRSLVRKMGPAAPGLTGLRPTLEECDTVIKQILAQKRQVSGLEAHIPDKAGAGADAPSPAAPATRAAAYEQLRQAAALLRQLEPHSPIPYLVQRAVELGALPFPQLIRALVRDANVLNELNRELGIKDQEPPSTGS
jgi:type VI secretion system protein ImpA